MHRACAALPVIATLFCAGEGYRFANAIQQSGPGIDAKLMVLTALRRNPAGTVLANRAERLVVRRESGKYGSLGGR